MYTRTQSVPNIVGVRNVYASHLPTLKFVTSIHYFIQSLQKVMCSNSVCSREAVKYRPLMAQVLPFTVLPYFADTVITLAYVVKSKKERSTL